MTTGALTSAAIGAWLLKCNSALWDIRAALGEGEVVHSWRLYPSYRVGLVRPGQPVVLWVTGRGLRGAPAPGIHTRRARSCLVVGGDDYWLDEGERRKLRPYMNVRMVAVPVVPREQLVGDPRTARIEVLRAPQGSNPSYLDHVEKEAVEEMIGGWPGL